MSLPKVMRALKATGVPSKPAVRQVPLPSLRPGYVLVKNKAVALNPTDWKSLLPGGTPNATVGVDYAGVVEEVGEGVEKPLKKGDRIFGFVHGNNSDQLEDGAFAEYILAKGDLQIKIPDHMSFEEATTLGLAIATVGQGLYQASKLPWPTSPAKEKFPVLIYGGSTATGIVGIQFAKLSGLEVITTSSPRNFDYVKQYGADKVFDYNSPTCGEEIRKYTNNRLFHAWDCFGEGPSMKICADALSSEKSPSGEKPLYATILRSDAPRDDVTSVQTMAYTVFGDKFDRMNFPPLPEHFEHGKKFHQMAEQLVAEGKIKASRPEVRSGGLEAIPQGLDDLQNLRVSGRKLVYTIE